MSPTKKKILIFSLILDVIIVALILFYYFGIPHSQIEALKTGYVKIDIDADGKASYTQVEKKPKQWVSIHNISKITQQAIVISEDWAFYEHTGVDWAQVQKAIEDSVKEGKRPRGASTITQQVAKNLYLSHDYSVIRKAREAAIAFSMDRKLNKNKILETYLNIAEFGPGIYGIGAAAKYYFGKAPSQLNAREAAFLAMLLPSPTRYSQSFKDKELSEYAKETIESIFEKLRLARMLSKEEVDEQLYKTFDWEKIEPVGTPIQKPEKSTAKPSQKAAPRKRDGSQVENEYRVDRELEIEDNPDFDDDAIIDQVEGVDAEYTLE